MDIAAEVCSALASGSLPEIYKQKVRSQRTRSIRIDVPTRENLAEIQYTLLGIELKVGKRRFACPDLATARYMRVFARLGCVAFAIPYDISRISGIADELETAWQRSILILDQHTAVKASSGVAQARSKLIKPIRDENAAVGTGEDMTEF